MVTQIDCTDRTQNFKAEVSDLADKISDAAIKGAQFGGVIGADQAIHNALAHLRREYSVVAPHILTDERLGKLQEAVHRDIATHAPSDPLLAISLKTDIGNIMHVGRQELGEATAAVGANCVSHNLGNPVAGRGNRSPY